MPQWTKQWKAAMEFQRAAWERKEVESCTEPEKTNTGLDQ